MRRLDGQGRTRAGRGRTASTRFGTFSVRFFGSSGVVAVVVVGGEVGEGRKDVALWSGLHGSVIDGDLQARRRWRIK